MPHDGPYRFVYGSRSNSPLYMIEMSMSSYVKLGVPKNKIVMLLAWFGSDFICAQPNCSTVSWSPSTNGGCGQALDGGPGSGRALALLNNETALGKSTDARPMWDEDTATPYFRWLNSSNKSDIHELWYESPDSFGKKCVEAKRVDARGIGIWLPENAVNEEQAAAMWEVIPLFDDTATALKTDDFVLLPGSPQTMYTKGAPHTNRVGERRATYSASESFLPLVLYHSIIQGQAGLNFSSSHYATAGSNTLHFWKQYSVPQQLVEARKHGLQTILHVGTGNATDIAATVKPFANDPNVLSWFLAEEPTSNSGCTSTTTPSCPAYKKVRGHKSRHQGGQHAVRLQFGHFLDRESLLANVE